MAKCNLYSCRCWVQVLCAYSNHWLYGTKSHGCSKAASTLVTEVNPPEMSAVHSGIMLPKVTIYWQLRWASVLWPVPSKKWKDMHSNSLVFEAYMSCLKRNDRAPLPFLLLTVLCNSSQQDVWCRVSCVSNNNHGHSIRGAKYFSGNWNWSHILTAKLGNAAAKARSDDSAIDNYAMPTLAKKN